MVSYTTKFWTFVFTSSLVHYHCIAEDPYPSHTEIQRQKQKRRRRGEKEDQKMRCNTHFFSHFSLKLGKTDINWEKLVKEAQKWPKNDVYPRKHTFSQKWLKHYFLPNFSSRGQFFLECRYVRDRRIFTDLKKSKIAKNNFHSANLLQGVQSV